MAYFETLTARVVAEVPLAGGSRSGALRKAAMRLFGVVKGSDGAVQGWAYDAAHAALESAGLDTGLSGQEVQDTLASAWRRVKPEAPEKLAHVAYFSGGQVSGHCAPPAAPDLADASDGFRRRAADFCAQARVQLWAQREPRPGRRLTPLQWLVERYGLTEDVIWEAQLGYHPADSFEDLAEWGMSADRDTKKQALPAGIVIPWRGADGDVQKVELRKPVDGTGERWELTRAGRARAASFAPNTTEHHLLELSRKWRAPVTTATVVDALEQRVGDSVCDALAGLETLAKAGMLAHPLKVRTLRGSANIIYGLGRVRAGQPALLVEGVFNALAVQVVGLPLPVVALGASTHGRVLAQARQLRAASCVLLAQDSGPAGEESVAWWLANLEGRGVRWRPMQDDPAAMLVQLGPLGLAQWAEAGHAWVLSREQPASEAAGVMDEQLRAWALRQAQDCVALAPEGDGYSVEEVRVAVPTGMGAGGPFDVWRLYDNVTGAVVAVEWTEALAELHAEMLG